MKYAEREVRSVSDLIKFLKEDRPEKEPLWFRGQADAAWSLLPSLARSGGIDVELTLFKRFKQNALPFMMQRPETEWEWLFVMQHHGLPTRLLDWTESPLVALYFIVTDNTSVDRAGALWTLLPLELNKASKFQARFKNDIPGFGDDDHLDSYLPSKLRSQQAAYGPLAAIALRNNPRIQVQQGVFTVSHIELTPLEGDGNAPYLWRYIIPAEAKADIRAELDMLNISKLSLFPELANVSEHARGFLA